MKIGHVGPLTGGIAHLGKDNENGARLAVEEANAAKIKIDGKEVKFTLVAEDDQADPKVGDGRAEAGRREGGRRGRSPQLGDLDSSLADLQPGGHPDDFGLGLPSSPSRASRTSSAWSARRPAGPGDRELSRHQQQAEHRRGDRRRHRLRRRHRQRGGEDAQGGEDQRSAAREGHRQDDRLEGDPHQAARRNPDAVFYGGMDAPWAAAQAGPRARHQGRVLVRRRRVHRQDEELAGDAARGCCARRPASRSRRRTRNSSTPTRRNSTPTRSSTRPLPTTRPIC